MGKRVIDIVVRTVEVDETGSEKNGTENQVTVPIYDADETRNISCIFFTEGSVRKLIAPYYGPDGRPNATGSGKITLGRGNLMIGQVLNIEGEPAQEGDAITEQMVIDFWNTYAKSNLGFMRKCSGSRVAC